MGSRLRSLAYTVVAVALVGACTAACKRDPNFDDRPVVIYSSVSCPISKADSYAVIYGSGDFDPTEDHPAVASFFLRDDGTPFSGLPADTRALLVDVSHLTNGLAWRGTSEVPKTGPINVLVWPNEDTCSLRRSVESRNDPTQRDVTLAVVGHHVMVFGGQQQKDAGVPRTYVGDLTTAYLEAAQNSVLVPRAFASVTAFGADDPAPILVAGGIDPEKEQPNDVYDVPAGVAFEPVSTAEIYIPDPTAEGAIGSFDRATIPLSVPRAQHGAVTLANGMTLLVGGFGEGRAVLGQLEAINPVKRETSREGLRSLRTPRARPDVVRMANGEVLVWGGVGADGRNVSSFEWLDRNGVALARQTPDLVPGREHGLVPLPAGGALVVIAPEDPSNRDFQTVWVVSSDGTLEAAIPIDPAELRIVRLFRGFGGAPVLWTGLRWLRWDPWFGIFQPIADAPASGPSSTAIANGDDGLALWLEDRGGDSGMYVTGYRFDARTRYAEVPPLLVGNPVGLAPDRLAGQPGGAIAFDPTTGLTVGPGASAFVTDVTFADFTADVEVGLAPPEIVLRRDDGIELSVGGAECAFGQNAQKTLHVERVKTKVTVSADGGPARECPTLLDEGVRVAIGIRGSSGANESRARNLRVTRR